MSTSTPWSGSRLLAASAILACAGTLLLYAGLRPQGGDAAPRPAPTFVRTATASTGPPAAQQPAEPGKGPAAVSSRPRSATSPRSPSAISTPVAAVVVTPSPARSGVVPSELPHPGSGPAGDFLIQQALERATPRDLEPAEEAALLQRGRRAWLVETAGYSRVRIQAATVRRGNSTADSDGAVRAVVRLVWAGADPAGTFLDGRPGAVYFTKNGDGSWDRMR